MSMMRGFFTVGFWTLVSRVLGFVRDVFIAGALGATPVAEAFVADCVERHCDAGHAIFGVDYGQWICGR